MAPTGAGVGPPVCSPASAGATVYALDDGVAVLDGYTGDAAAGIGGRGGNVVIGGNDAGASAAGGGSLTQGKGGLGGTRGIRGMNGSNA